MTELAGSIASAITDADLTTAFDPATPIVDVGSGCTHVQVFVSSATHGPGEVAQVLPPRVVQFYADFLSH
ncbi:MAG TPA: hypothetical protein VHT91_21755 [Kofleriaceae bacterium]|nr:hypothetical protein [Kofleriaceae bacterium]